MEAELQWQAFAYFPKFLCRISSAGLYMTFFAAGKNKPFFANCIPALTETRTLDIRLQ